MTKTESEKGKWAVIRASFEMDYGSDGFPNIRIVEDNFVAWVSDSNIAEVEDYGETITFKDFEVLYVFTGDERKDRKAWKLLRNSMAISRKESQ